MNFHLFETIFLEDLLLLRQKIQYPFIFININVHASIIYYLCIKLISYNTTMPVKYNHIFLMLSYEFFNTWTVTTNS